MTEWVSVKDRLPPEDVNILGAIIECRETVKIIHVDIVSRVDQEWGYALNPKHGKVTHWMPLPNPPEFKEIE